MASADVIELGSSDDEPEPAQTIASVSASTSKKVKPPLNAMVHIPSQLPGLTIKPTKTQIIPNKYKSTVRKIVPLPISNVVHNPYAGKTIFKLISGGQPNAIKNIKINSIKSINPMSVTGAVNNPQALIKKVARKTTAGQTPKGFVNIPIHKKPSLQSQKIIPKLPPGITVTRTTEQIKRKRSMGNVVPSKQLFKKPKFDGLSQVGDVLTVELDDDDSTQTSAASAPKWYIKPEDQVVASMENKNNKETDPKIFEITIEDSPVKAHSKKHTGELEKQDAITIEDSPVKPTTDKHKQTDAQTTCSGSDEDDERFANKKHSPNSKKKLEYNKNTKKIEHTSNAQNLSVNNSDLGLTDSIEIEIEPFNEPEILSHIEHTENCSSKPNDSIIEIDESPLKKSDLINEKNSSVIKINQPNFTETNSLCNSKENDFHPIYQNFIEMCFKLENSEDMKKIVEKKIKPYYRQVPKEYTESEEFLEMVSSKIESMKTGPDKMYLYIKDIVDELNLQRKMAKSQAAQDETKKALEAAAFYGEKIEQDSKRKRQVRKLEKTIKKLHRAIQKLEDQEVDFDDDGDSVYILTESEADTIIESSTKVNKTKPTERDRNKLLQRYKERLVRVHAKLCQLSNTKMPSEPRVHLEPRAGQPAGAARRLEKWINRRVPVGTPLPFPDFHDVLRCVRDANQQDHLGWNEADIMEEARDLFIRCGRKLQRRRQENEWRNTASRLTTGSDPAEDSIELKMKLEENRKICAQKESELINKFADKQKQMKLEAVEIGDKEAEESPVESGDEAQGEEKDEEDTSLESAVERKERIRRLLKEKSKCSSQNIEVCDDSSQEQNVIEKEISSVPDEIISEDINQQTQITDKDENTLLNKDKSAVEVELKSKEVEIEVSTKTDEGVSVVQKSGSADSVLCLSDDSNKLDSDVDELHLLQKLHSGTDIASSTLESSDTDTPIAISDTLDSSDEVENKNSINASDVVSIENSSYSESETTKEHGDEKDYDSDINMDNVNETRDEAVRHNDNEDVEMLSENDEPKKQNRNCNEEYTEPVEDILLASSDDEAKEDECNIDSSDSTGLNCFKLKEDSMAIGDTSQETLQTDTQANLAITQLQEDSCIVAALSDCIDDTEITNSIKNVEIINNNKDVDITESNISNITNNMNDAEMIICEKSSEILVNVKDFKHFDNNKITEHDDVQSNSKTEENISIVIAENNISQSDQDSTEPIDITSKPMAVSTDLSKVALEISTEVVGNECEVTDVSNTAQEDNINRQSPNADELENELKLLLESDSNSCGPDEFKQTAQETTAEP